MFRKLAAAIAFGAGCYYGYQYSVEFLDVHAADFEGYWGQIWAQAIRIAIPLGLGAVAGVAVYFLCNLFARAD